MDPAPAGKDADQAVATSDPVRHAPGPAPPAQAEIAPEEPGVHSEGRPVGSPIPPVEGFDPEAWHFDIHGNLISAPPAAYENMEVQQLHMQAPVHQAPHSLPPQFYQHPPPSHAFRPAGVPAFPVGTLPVMRKLFFPAVRAAFVRRAGRLSTLLLSAQPIPATSSSPILRTCSRRRQTSVRATTKSPAATAATPLLSVASLRRAAAATGPSATSPTSKARDSSRASRATPTVAPAPRTGAGRSSGPIITVTANTATTKTTTPTASRQAEGPAVITSRETAATGPTAVSSTARAPATPPPPPWPRRPNRPRRRRNHRSPPRMRRKLPPREPTQRPAPGPPADPAEFPAAGRFVPRTLAVRARRLANFFAFLAPAALLLCSHLCLFFFFFFFFFFRAPPFFPPSFLFVDGMLDAKKKIFL
ncbi:MAG: hypothetical protein BJ554DRAFT_2988 [Olpidium bornovanus]|uniref:Uncharacterized protein n=1 Tax=Olpidium bornovanus TaxID=278681 RepID=A0A8H7ZP56_9FUNG|nr:MAG: hypothetical protein BJ554DRAFT_2988 [Olpidium bornovanus]